MEEERLAATAHALMAAWGCRPDGRMFFTHSSLLWPVVAAGENCMLKIANPDDDEAHAADMLRHYGDRGAVRLINSEGHAQLLERITDETRSPTLEQHVLAGKADAATHIICDVVEKLHAVKETAPLKHLIPFETRQKNVRKSVDNATVHEERRAQYETALRLGDELIMATQAEWQPLHGDIHHDNVMYSSMRGWLAIDPKGIFGPRAYDYAPALCNPFAATEMITVPTHMERQAEIMADRAALDKKQLLRFTFLHAIQCAAWSHGGEWQEHMHACADTAAELSEIDIM